MSRWRKIFLGIAGCLVTVHVSAALDGKALYEANCAGCHAAGANGAPQHSDEKAWTQRMNTDRDILTANAFLGKNAMPPKGGNLALTYVEVEAAVNYLLGKMGQPGVTAATTPRPTDRPTNSNAVAPAATAAQLAGDGGKSIYQTTCAACHAAGVGGAPKISDQSVWAPRLVGGPEALYTSALKGKGAMPPRGGNPTLADASVKAAVDYMIAQARTEATSAQPPPGAPAAATPKQEATAATDATTKPAVAQKPAAGERGAADAAKSGKVVYESTCAACHATGIGGAPKLGDAQAWGPRIETGNAALLQSALNGKNAMPAKGGNAALTEGEIKAAVVFMVGRAKTAAASKPAAKPPQSAAAPGAAPTASNATADKGKSTYESTCAACHDAGLAGAPKFADKSAWGPRVQTGMETLYTSALKGKNAMPAKGGNTALAEGDVKAAVDYMVAELSAIAAAAKTVATQPGQGESAAPAVSSYAASTGAAKSDKGEPPGAPNAQHSGAAKSQPAEKAVGDAALPPAAADPNSFNRLLRPVGKRNLPAAESGIHDPTNDGTHMLQAPLLSFSALPKSNSGNLVDWVRALNESKITPRTDKNDPNAEPLVLDMNIVREVKGSMPDVVYPHKQHTQWLDCSNCHPAIFIPQKGANQISMAAILLGQKCGVCHGKVAFPVSECRLCHSKNKETKTSEAKQ